MKIRSCNKKVISGFLIYISVVSLSIGQAPPSATQSTKESGTPATAGKPDVVAPVSGQAKHKISGSPVRYAPNPLSRRAEFYYESLWGVDSLKVKSAESNEVIRFTYRVLDPSKARILNDEKLEPSLVDPKAGVKLVVPALEKVGKLRQVSAPQADKTYWMAFSNKGHHVKPGDRVNIVIGNFRANGLVVE